MRYQFVFTLLVFIPSPNVSSAQFFDNLLQKEWIPYLRITLRLA